MKLGAVVLAGSLGLNLLAWYGGLRSPDEEVVFELCESLHDRRSVAVVGESRDPGFGLAPGADGRTYSIFGVGESLACVPFMTAARLIDRTGWYDGVRVNPSFYTGDGFERFLADRPPARPEAILHAERALVTLLTVVVSSLSALVFFAIARRLVQRPAAALAVTWLYAAGTPAWGYAGGFFSEPLATLLVLTSFWMVQRRAAAAAGAALGLAVATHVTAILFVPFFAAIAIRDADRATRARVAAAFGAGLGATLAALGAYNAVRFGDPLETGRTVSPALAAQFGYGTFVAPWRGLYGLLVSPGKGLLFYAPIALLGGWAWRGFHRDRPFLSSMLLAAIAVRVLFLACRSDWHGGFSLGPRYLVMALPFLLLPIAPWLDRRLEPAEARAARRGFVAASIACVAQQVMFVVGEPFSFYQAIRLGSFARGVDPFVGDEIYLAPRYSPVFHLMDGKRGSWLVRDVPLGNALLWLVLAAGLGVAYALVARAWARRGFAVDAPEPAR